MAQSIQTNGEKNAEAFITLATNDVYTRGALVLAESLRKYSTTRKLVVMITPHVSPSARVALGQVFDDVRMVDVLDSKDATHLALLKRPELGITFTKIHCWAFTEYTKCVFMDADMMVLQNIDELFEREELSASPDSGWPDVFNSGLFVFRPSIDTFNGLLLHAQNEGSFDGGDQGLLNTYFGDWATKDISRHLPFLYNLHVSASYTYLPAFKKFGKDTKVVHFLGPVKPWHHVYNKVTGGVQQIAGPLQSGTQHFPQYLSDWWALYNDKVQKYFSKEQELFTRQTKDTELKLPSHHKEADSKDQVCLEQEGIMHEQNTQETERRELHIEARHSPYNWKPPQSFYRDPPHSAIPEKSPKSTPPPEIVVHVPKPQRSRPLSPNVHTLEPQHSPTQPGDCLITSAASPSKLQTNPKEMIPTGPTQNEQKVFTTITRINKNSKYQTFKPTVLRSGQTQSLYNFIPIPKSLTEEMFHQPVKGNYMMAEEKSFGDIMLIPSAILPEPVEENEATPSSVPREPEDVRRDMLEHMRDWERGNIDYMGKDSWENIQKALDTFL